MTVMFCTRRDNNNVEDRRGGGSFLFKHPPTEARLAGEIDVRLSLLMWQGLS